MQKDFRQIVTEQREELDIILRRGWIPREQEASIDLNSRLAQIITGVRRSGKSTLAHRALQDKKYAYINFDDERLAGLDADNLNHLLEAVYTVYGEFSHLLLDEIQNVEQWHLFVNRLLRNDIRIIITGSNSRLLSTEMGTHLTGRYVKTELFPFSFKEFLKAKEDDLKLPLTARGKGLLLGHFLEYERIGGFPDLLTEEPSQTYIKALFDSIVTNDIVFRHNIRYSRTFRELSIHLLNNYSSEISYNRLKTIFGLGSENTAKNYVHYLEEAYLISCLPKFSFKKQESLRYRKVYMIDTAFAAISGNQYSRNDGRLLENVVYLDLARKADKSGYELFYFKKLVEVDFVIYANSKVRELIQVAYSVADQKTLKREIRALLTAAKELNAGKLTIITLEETNEIQEENMTIKIIPITQWLLRD